MMTDTDKEDFVARFAAAWASRDPEQFLALWHPDGELHYPFADRVIHGREIGKLNELQNAQAPKLAWKLLGWTSRGDVVVIEWESSNTYGDTAVTWRGVDKMTLKDGRIMEEIVYADTAPLQAMRQGRPFEPLMRLPE